MTIAITPTNANSIVDILRARAARSGERVAFTYLRDGERDEISMSFAELHERSRAIAETIRRISDPGARALLLYPTGLEFIEAFFGCLYAGIVAVPAYPPPPGRAARHRDRLERIVNDATATVLLSTSTHLRHSEELRGLSPRLSVLRTLATDTLLDKATDAGLELPKSEQLAFLQYTSGSTSDPKGTMVTHGNVIANARATQRLFGISDRDVTFSWLPCYHDMGLIGMVLNTVAFGLRTVLMAPAHFVDRPERWLLGISRYRVTASGGPDFAYDLCTRMIPDELLAGLDLSSWRVAVNGAEPVRYETMTAFTDRFARCGFRSRAFHPSYGLAESTLIVSSGPFTPEQGVEWIDGHALSTGSVEIATAATGVPAVSCGSVDPAATVEIVDPHTLQPADDRQVGEIWVSGPSVAAGYWNQPDATSRTFAATVPGSDRRFLRTGDLGFIHRGRLFITGRHKDLLIIRGRNYYPQDVERTVLASHEGFSPVGGAAFTVETESGESLVVVHALDRRKQAVSVLMAQVAREAIAAVYELAVHDLVLVDPREIPKTSSGKIRRQECKRLYLAGAFGPRDPARSAEEATPDDPLVAVTWKFQEERAGSSRAQLLPATWLIYGAQGSAVSTSLYRMILTRGDRCFFLQEGDRFEHRADGSVTFRPDAPEAMAAAIASDFASHRMPLRGVIFVCDQSEPRLAGSDARYAALWTGLRALHGAIPGDRTGSSHLWVITRGARVVAGEDVTDPAGAAFGWALSRWPAEAIGAGFTTIDLDPGGEPRELAMLRHELSLALPEGPVAFRGTRRFVARVERFFESTTAANGTVVPPTPEHAIVLYAPNQDDSQRVTQMLLAANSVRVLAVGPFPSSGLAPGAAAGRIQWIEADLSAPSAVDHVVAAARQMSLEIKTVWSVGWPGAPLTPEEVPVFERDLRLIDDLATRLGASDAFTIVRERGPAVAPSLVVPQPFHRALACRGRRPRGVTVFADSPAMRSLSSGSLRALDGPSSCQPTVTLVPLRRFEAAKPGPVLRERMPVRRVQETAVVPPVVPRPAPPTAAAAPSAPVPATRRLLRDDDVTRDELVACPVGTQREKIAAFIQSVAARALGIPAQHIDMTRPLTDAGLDSSVTAEIRTVIERRLRIRISMGQLMKGPTGEEFAGMVVQLINPTGVSES